MPTFSYKAKNQAGEERSGRIDASSEHELAQQLRQEGFYLTSAVLQSKQNEKRKFSWQKIIGIFSGVSLAEKMIFARHLSTMIKAGLPIDRSIRTLIEQSRNQKFRRILAEVEENIRQGQTLSVGLKQYPEVFSEFFVSMVRVGETSGNLEEVLRGLAAQMEKDYELRSRVRGAMIYPSVIISLMVIIGALMMVLVVPKLASVFEEMNVELPWTTRIIISISEFLASDFITVILIFIMAIFLIRTLLQTQPGRRTFDWIVLNTPVFSTLSQKINSARFARNLSTLSEAGIPIMLALQIVSRTMTNSLFRESLMVSSSQIQKGDPLNKILRNFGSLYPVLVIQMLEVGETTGSLSEILKELAEFYEGEVNNETKNISSVIEPILMIIVGAVVGLFAVSMIQPIYSLMGQI